MSPVLPLSTSRFTSRRRPVRSHAVRFLPFRPNEPSPNQEAGALSRGAAGWCKGSVESSTADCPPPQLQTPHAPLVGIARLAAKSPAAETKRKSGQKPEYFLLPVKSILNRCESQRVPFEWTINPYRGCEFACKYCYARYTHEYMEIDGRGIREENIREAGCGRIAGARREPEIFLRIEGQRLYPGGTHRDWYRNGSVPARGERIPCNASVPGRIGETRWLEHFDHHQVRPDRTRHRHFDGDCEKSALSINITVTTLKPRLARLLEPRAPRPDLRLEAVRKLREAGLNVGVSASPLVPGITDGEGELEAVADAAKLAGAQWFFSGVLFLMPASAKTFLPFIREKFPKLAKQYEKWYAKNGYAPEEYRKKVSERVLRIRQEFDFSARPWEGERPKSRRLN